MSQQLIRAASRALSWLPLRLNRVVGAGLGQLAWVSRSRSRRVTEMNVDLCYPEMDDRQRSRLCRQSLIETGIQLTECAWIWNRPTWQTAARILEVRGQSLLDAARQSEKGLIMVSPHIGNWELCALPLSTGHKFTYFYRSPRRRTMNQLLIEWRAHLGGQPATLDAAGIREGLRILRKGGTVGILPDQEPDLQNGQFAPFFGVPALTMTLLSRLARKSGATVLFCIAERVYDKPGWRLHIRPAAQDMASDDPVEATTALNKALEQCIAICPPQYLWDYRRFNTLPDGTRRNYH